MHHNNRPKPTPKIGLVEFVKLTAYFNKSFTNPLEAGNWIKKIEKAFAGYHVSDERKMPYTAYMLQGLLVIGGCLRINFFLLLGINLGNPSIRNISLIV